MNEKQLAINRIKSLMTKDDNEDRFIIHEGKCYLTSEIDLRSFKPLPGKTGKKAGRARNGVETYHIGGLFIRF